MFNSAGGCIVRRVAVAMRRNAPHARCASVLVSAVQPLKTASSPPRRGMRVLLCARGFFDEGCPCAHATAAPFATLSLDQLAKLGGPTEHDADSAVAGSPGFFGLSGPAAASMEGSIVNVGGREFTIRLEPVVSSGHVDTLTQKKRELADLQGRMAGLLKARRPLHAAALTHSHHVAWGLAAGLLTQSAIIFKLTFFSELGWDVMEPIAYFLTFGVGLASLFFFQFLGVEFTYPALRRALVERYMTKVVKARGFDEAQYNLLAAAIIKKHKALAALPDADIFYRDAYAGIRALMASTDIATPSRDAEVVHCVNREGWMLEYNFLTGQVVADSAAAAAAAAADDAAAATDAAGTTTPTTHSRGSL